MNQKLWSGLTTTALTTTIGTTLFLGSLLPKTVASNLENTLDVNPDVLGTKIESLTSATPISGATESFNRDTLLLGMSILAAEKPTATIDSHLWQGNQAVTLRVSNIPVVTFLSSSTDSAARNPHAIADKTQAANDPLLRAKAVAARLNQLSQENVDASQITVGWNRDSQTYSIKVNKEELISLNEQTVLPDTSKNLAADALQITNRLRRLMGDAPPLTVIADKPQKQPERIAGTKEAGNKQQKRGIASWYGPGFNGKKTASGERFNSNGLTAAHRSLPFGTRVRVTNLNNGRSVVVRINDRGPFSRARVIDLSAGAARIIGVAASGVAPVRLEVLGR